MSFRSQQIQGKRIYENDGVLIEGITKTKVYFLVLNEYQVLYDMETFQFIHCTCEYGSLWKSEKEQECRHVQACKYWIRNELKNFLSKHYETINQPVD